jgi:flagellar basal body-associated protein FliL
MKPARVVALLLIIAIVIFVALVGYVAWGINQTVQEDRRNVPENIGE